MADFSVQTREILRFARAEAQLLQSDCVGSEHLLLGCMQEGTDNSVAHILHMLGLSLEQMRAAITQTRNGSEICAYFTPEARHIIHLAFDEARKRQQPFVTVEHLFYALLFLSSNKATFLLQTLGINLEELGGLVAQTLPRDDIIAEALPIRIGSSGPGGRDKFTQRARKALYRATEEALLFEQGVDREHLLLGLLYEREGIAFQVVKGLGVDLLAMEQAITQMLGQSDQVAPVLMPRCKKSIELAVREAVRFGHRYLGTEHLLLGMLSTCEEINGSDSLFTRLGLSARRDEGDQLGRLFARFNLTLKQARKQTSLVLATGLRDDAGPF